MIEKLREKLGERVMENESLAKHTNFRIGGPAKYFFEARTSDEIVRAVQAASELGVPFFVLGGGSNVLVSDNGFDGLIVKAANRDVKTDGTTVIAEAGSLSALVARKTAEAGLTGFEWAISLPGTIGGAVRGNAGCFGGEMKDVVTSVWALIPVNTIYSPTPEIPSRLVGMDEGESPRSAAEPPPLGAKRPDAPGVSPGTLYNSRELESGECAFRYRDSVFKHIDPPPIVLSATLELKRDDSKACVARVEEKLRLRKEKQPLEASSAGCIFKNVEFQNEEKIAKLREHAEVPKECIRAKRIPAGWIIEQLGLKGHRIGDAQISEKHGNFVMNLGQATADQVIQLIALVKTRARNELGIQLQEEVQYIGF